MNSQGKPQPHNEFQPTSTTEQTLENKAKQGTIVDTAIAVLGGTDRGLGWGPQSKFKFCLSYIRLCLKTTRQYELTKQTKHNQVWWQCISIMPILRKQRQGDEEPKPSSKLACAT